MSDICGSKVAVDESEVKGGRVMGGEMAARDGRTRERM